MTDWKRGKEIPSSTHRIETAGCGTAHITLGYEELENTRRLIEVRVLIGKNGGSCGNILLDTIAKLISVYLQSSEPRYKVIKKLKHLFMPDTKGNAITCTQGRSCIEDVIRLVLKELEV